MGEHFTCLDEANRITRTEQKFVRTETKCVRSDQQSLGGGQGTIYNPGRGDVNCTSTPIYETVILNQSERDSVYQNCRNRITNQTQRSQQSTKESPSTQSQWSSSFSNKEFEDKKIKAESDRKKYCMNLPENQRASSPLCKTESNKCSSQAEIQCQKLNRKCISNGVNQWCSN
jgi:hypothetical protein